MKHFALSLLSCVVICMTSTSCGEEKEDLTQYDLRTFIIGEWSSDVTPSSTINFKSDGTGYSNYSSIHPFKWILNGNHLAVKHNTSSFLDKEGEVEILGKNKIKWDHLTYTRIGEYEPENPSNPETGEYAPAALTGKIIRFFEYDANSGLGTGDNNRIQFYTEHDMRANWASQSSSYTYTKTGQNTGRLNFICGQTVNYVTRVFRYDVTLTFLDSEGKFELNGYKEITGALSGNGTYKITGKGSYWPQLWD